MKHATLCYLLKDNQVCLGLKKRGFGINRWNGFGGKVEEGESIEKAVQREVREETGVCLSSLEKVAEIHFFFPKAEKSKGWDQIVHVYFSSFWVGEPTESEEMRPRWFSFAEIPYESSWPDDKVWLPLVLSGQKVRGEFYFDEHDKILKQRIESVEGF